MDANILTWAVIACIMTFIMGVSGMIIFTGERENARSARELRKKLQQKKDNICNF